MMTFMHFQKVPRNIHKNRLTHLSITLNQLIGRLYESLNIVHCEVQSEMWNKVTDEELDTYITWYLIDNYS